MIFHIGDFSFSVSMADIVNKYQGATEQAGVDFHRQQNNISGSLINPAAMDARQHLLKGEQSAQTNIRKDTDISADANEHGASIGMSRPDLLPGPSSHQFTKQPAQTNIRKDTDIFADANEHGISIGMGRPDWS